jgi:AAA15 family ATPase/GTPase
MLFSSSSSRKKNDENNNDKDGDNCPAPAPASMSSLPGNAALREFMDRITSTTHVNQYIELPMICVMGDTSSGKSSLLSALSMVELPSSHELTTKCPILLQMTPSNETTMEATVSIQWNNNESTNGSNGQQHFETVHISENNKRTRL